MSEPFEPNGSALETHHFKSGADRDHGVQLFLYRKPNPGGMPLLLLHGASARHETFMIPRPDPFATDGRSRCLMDWLYEEGFEPWLLDWRGSGLVVDFALTSGSPGEHPFDLDAAAQWDIPAALEQIREVRSDAQEIGAIGHCVGAGALAHAIALGCVADHPLKHIVLLTLGLFYEPPLDGRLKTQDHVLERLLLNAPSLFEIDPRRTGWHPELEKLYENWPMVLRPHSERELSHVHGLCDRLSFMYGTPYFEKNLVPEIHQSTAALSFGWGRVAPLAGEVVKGEHSRARGVVEAATRSSGSWQKGDASGWLVLIGTSGHFQAGERLLVGKTVMGRCTSPAREAPAELPRQFGAIPLRLYAHAAQNARRRWAARFGRPNDDTELINGEARAHFDALESATLITGAKNQLWHRDSIDRMHEWLRRGWKRSRKRCRKRVLKDYGHQDLLWGRCANVEVFPEIRAGLPDDPTVRAAAARPRSRLSGDSVIRSAAG